MSTQIKRLLQTGTEFVPITAAEAVVVNTTNIPGLQSYGITTLDKVLRTVYGLVGTHISDVDTLITQINQVLENKQDKLTPGTGITIDQNGVISATNTGSVQLYKIPDPSQTWPTASAETMNTIYLKVLTSPEAGNAFEELITIYDEANDRYVWEKIGNISSDVDLTNYVSKTEFNAFVAQSITATNVKKSDNSNVTITYDIPTTLYDDLEETQLID